MILVYTPHKTPRIRYTFRLIFKDLLGLDLHYTHSKEEYLQATSPKINYSREALQSGIYLQSAPLLYETDINEQELKTGSYQGVPSFFQTGVKSALPFDPLAASFYLVSRYEEYIPFIPDAHGRFPAQAALMHKLEAMHLPLVNIYARFIRDLLQEHYPNLRFREPKYQFYNSVDIDNASAYMGKGILRILIAYARDLVSFNFKEISQRTRCLFGGMKDPFNTFEQVLKWQRQYGFSSIYFALFTHLGQYDRSLSRYSSRLQSYLKSIADFNEVGIHPSYRSFEKKDLLEEEISSLSRILRKDVTRSRQHFIRLQFPTTYRNLLEFEITDDYSMGFASEHGFRAGICTPFRFYDLEQELETPLRVHPFPFMDGTFIYYLKQSPAEAWEIIDYYIKTYRDFGGEFIPIWHNRIYSEKEDEWKGWNQLFERMVAAAV